MDEVICNVVGVLIFVFVVFIVYVRLRFVESEVFIYVIFDICSIGFFVLEDIVVSLDINGIDI